MTNCPPIAPCHSTKRRIAFVCFDRFQLLDLAGPADVFDSAHQFTDSAYDLHAFSKSGGLVRSDAGVCIETRKFEPLVGFDSLIVVGGRGVFAAAKDRAITRYVRTQAQSVRRVISICTGCFVLAGAGLLAGKTVATHWQYADRLRRSAPGTKVDTNAIYVRDGSLITSAGVSSGVDLALALVEDDSGHDVAMAVARDLVVVFCRPGRYAQVSEQLKAQMLDADVFRDLCTYIVNHPAQNLSIEALADRARMSPRNFSRRFRKDVGVSPGQFVEDSRLSTAKNLLETTRKSAKQIAHQCGFGNEETLRRAFRRRYGMSALVYRAMLGKLA